MGTARGVQGRAMVKTVPAAAPPPSRARIFGRRRPGTPGSEHSPVRGVDRPACDVQACSWPAQGKKHYGAIPAPSVVTQCANMVLRTPYLRKTAQCWRDGVGAGSRSRGRTCRMPIKLGGLLDCEVESQCLKSQRLFFEYFVKRAERRTSDQVYDRAEIADHTGSRRSRSFRPTRQIRRHIPREKR